MTNATQEDTQARVARLAGASPLMMRVLSVVLGALPATWLALFAAMVMIGAVENIEARPFTRTLSALWGLGGVLGAIGGWLIIFDVGFATNWIRRVVILLVAAGIAAASVLLIGLFFPTLFRPRPLSIAVFLGVASAIGVGLFQISRVTRAPARVVLGWTATGYGIAIAFLAAEPLYTNVVDTERLVKWDCWVEGACDENADVARHYIKYSFPGGAWYQMEVPTELLAHLKRLEADEVKAKLRVQTRFGRFESFTIVELAGFPIEGGSARNSNQPEPPFPTRGVDDPSGRQGS